MPKLWTTPALLAPNLPAQTDAPHFRLNVTVDEVILTFHAAAAPKH